MKKGKCLISAALITAMMGTMLAGCAKTEQAPTNSTQASSGEAQKASDPGKKVSLRFSWWGGDSRHEATLACELIIYYGILQITGRTPDLSM